MFVDIMNYDLVNYIKHFIFQNKAELRGSLLFINKPKKRGFFSPNREAEVYALLYVRPSMHICMLAASMLKGVLSDICTVCLKLRCALCYMHAHSRHIWMLKAEMYGILYERSPVCSKLKCMLFYMRTHPCIFVGIKLKFMIYYIRRNLCIFVYILQN